LGSPSPTKVFRFAERIPFEVVTQSTAVKANQISTRAALGNRKINIDQPINAFFTNALFKELQLVGVHLDTVRRILAIDVGKCLDSVVDAILVTLVNRRKSKMLLEREAVTYCWSENHRFWQFGQ